MNEERFDELTRTLATGRLTRWQVLKGLWAGVLLGSAGFLQPWSASFAEAQTRAVKKAPVGSLSNPRKDYVRVGSCEKFNDYIQKKGVTDEDKMPHKELTAITTYSCGWNVTQSKVEVTSRNKNRVCLRTTQVLVKFEGDTTVTVATWKPPKQLSAACECEKTNYDEAAIEHERWHVNDIHEVEANHTESWNRNQPEFKACGGGQFAEKKAKKALRKEIKKSANKECLRINAEIERRGKEYDKTHKLQPMECSFCKPGKKASNSKCKTTKCQGAYCPCSSSADCCQPSQCCGGRCLGSCPSGCRPSNNGQLGPGEECCLAQGGICCAPGGDCVQLGADGSINPINLVCQPSP